MVDLPLASAGWPPYSRRVALRLIAVSDGAEIAVHDFGGSGRLAVLTHGTGFCAGMLGPVVVRLGDRFHSITIDTRAHGASPSPPNGDMTRPRLASDIMEIAGALEAPSEGLVGIGHSSGAHALLAAEVRRPGTFSALYCYEPIFPTSLFGPSTRSPNLDRTLRRRSRFSSREQAREHFNGRGSFATVAPEALDAYIAEGVVEDLDGGVRLACRPEDEAGILASPIFYDSETDLATIACPLHLAYGENNEAQGGRSVRHLAGIVAGATVTALPGLGHLGPFENPALVASWIASIDDDALSEAAPT